MADVNVYTARRLKSMALSLGGLAQAFADEIGGQGHLTKEDGLAAMQTAASAVCGDCTRCNLYYGSRRDDSYYLYYLLRTFEQKGKIDLEDMPRLFHEICSQREAYLRELNRSLGRATMNLGWKTVSGKPGRGDCPVPGAGGDSGGIFQPDGTGGGCDGILGGGAFRDTPQKPSARGQHAGASI